jgi:hypothetical protein
MRNVFMEREEMREILSCKQHQLRMGILVLVFMCSEDDVR